MYKFTFGIIWVIAINSFCFCWPWQFLHLLDVQNFLPDQLFSVKLSHSFVTWQGFNISLKESFPISCHFTIFDQANNTTQVNRPGNFCLVADRKTNCLIKVNTIPAGKFAPSKMSVIPSITSTYLLPISPRELKDYPTLIYYITNTQD